MIDSLSELVFVIKEFVFGIIDGLYQVAQSLFFVAKMVLGIGSTNVYFFPSAIFAVVSVCVFLIVVLRIVGR